MYLLPEAARIHSFITSITEFWFVALSSIFFLVDPFAAVPPFISMTSRADSKARRRMASRAAWTCFIVLTLFALSGTFIFKLFGITLAAFEIAGGLILLLIGIDMLQARRSTQEGVSETEEGALKEDISITPLGVPLLAGPGAISTVMVLMGASPNWKHTIPVFVGIAFTAYASYIILASADRVRKRIGETGIRIMMRIMGLMLTAIAVQFVINGLARMNIINVSPP
ncbi:MAG: antibiotic resistance protein MarC [Acidobacteria bacterium]|nr:MAG: antibiotic resistance protein MarC [Acidobacteriota bacterium]